MVEREWEGPARRTAHRVALSSSALEKSWSALRAAPLERVRPRSARRHRGDARQPHGHVGLVAPAVIAPTRDGALQTSFGRKARAREPVADGDRRGGAKVGRRRRQAAILGPKARHAARLGYDAQQIEELDAKTLSTVPWMPG